MALVLSSANMARWPPHVLQWGTRPFEWCARSSHRWEVSLLRTARPPHGHMAYFVASIWSAVCGRCDMFCRQSVRRISLTFLCPTLLCRYAVRGRQRSARPVALPRRWWQASSYLPTTRAPRWEFRSAGISPNAIVVNNHHTLSTPLRIPWHPRSKETARGDEVGLNRSQL